MRGKGRTLVEVAAHPQASPRPTQRPLGSSYSEGGRSSTRRCWDAKAFEERAACFEEQYAGYSPVEGVNLNGKLTLGESSADNGGLRVALMALERVLKNKPAAPVDGFTPAQRLFLGWSQVWRQNIADEAARLRAQTDPHSPGEFRVNGVVSNMPEFRQAFSCETGQPMAPEKMCRVW